MNQIKNKLSYLMKHELISGSFYVFIGTTASSFLAFILNVYFARELTYAEYGVLASLSSLIALLTIPSSSLSAIVVRYATVYFANNEISKASKFYKKTFLNLILLSIFINVVTLLFFPFLSSFLKIESIVLVLISSLSVTAFYFATLNMAFIQSLLKFRLLGILYLIAGVGKLASGIILVMLGFNVYGAIFATLVFSLIDFIFGFYPITRIIKTPSENINIGTKTFISYAAPTAIAIFSLSSFISIDVILVKHYFSAVDAGLYGGLSLVGKVIFYFTGPIALAMFPLIVKKHSSGEKYHGLFLLSLSLVIVSSLIITLFYFIFPEFVLNMFLGGKDYLKMANYLGLFGIFLTIYSINNVFINFFLSIKKTSVFIVVLVFALLQIILIYLFHRSFMDIINISIFISILLMISLVIYYLKLNASKSFHVPNK